MSLTQVDHLLISGHSFARSSWMASRALLDLGPEPAAAACCGRPAMRHSAGSIVGVDHRRSPPSRRIGSSSARRLRGPAFAGRRTVDGLTSGSCGARGGSARDGGGPKAAVAAGMRPMSASALLVRSPSRSAAFAGACPPGRAPTSPPWRTGRAEGIGRWRGCADRSAGDAVRPPGRAPGRVGRPVPAPPAAVALNLAAAPHRLDRRGIPVENPTHCTIWVSIVGVGHQGIIAMNDPRENAISPDDFVDGVLGYLKTAALKGALALDLFSAIPDNGRHGRSDRRSRAGFAARGTHSLRFPHSPRLSSKRRAALSARTVDGHVFDAVVVGLAG